MINLFLSDILKDMVKLLNKFQWEQRCVNDFDDNEDDNDGVDDDDDVDE